MSSFTQLNSILRSNFDEDGWVVQIRRNLDEELEEENEVPVSIFKVPKLLFVSDPDSYQPQQIAIGPYHYFTPEHYEMERYKVAAAKIVQKEHHSLKFHHVVDMVNKYEPRIRAHYHRYLNVNSETLAWMMAVDASFLLEFLRIYAVKEGKVLPRTSSSMSHCIDSAGTKSTHNAILRDVVMLENQIPLFLLRKVLEFQISSLELADDLLISMLKGFILQLSPFKTAEELPCNIQVSKSAHLLDVLYHVIVRRRELGASEMEEFEEKLEVKEGEEEHSFEKSSYAKKLLDMICKKLSKLEGGPVRIIKNVLISKPLKLVSKLPWTIISNFPGVKLLKQPFENLFSSLDTAKEEENENPKGNDTTEKPPLVEEITIPSVTELSKAGVRFLPINSGISSICFDVKTATFYLPTVCLDVNSEVVLRNLVAYEACCASGQLVFARYVELMNGIIDTDEDAKVLREKGIILNHLKKDADVAKLWNGMNRSVKLTKVDFFDKTIAEVNKFYSCRWKVKFKKYLKYYVFGSWKFLTFIACLLMLFLMALQAFCSVYSCPRMFNRVQDFQS